jgi:hypothetical protein
MKRRVVFLTFAVIGAVAVVLGIRAGDLETIHRFAAQI